MHFISAQIWTATSRNPLWLSKEGFDAPETTSQDGFYSQAICSPLFHCPKNNLPIYLHFNPQAIRSHQVVPPVSSWELSELEQCAPDRPEQKKETLFDHSARRKAKPLTKHALCWLSVLMRAFAFSDHQSNTNDTLHQNLQYWGLTPVSL